MSRRWVAIAVLGAALCLAAPAFADGDDFFLTDDGSPPILQYIGHVRDAAGKPIGGAAIFVEVKHPRVYVKTTSVRDGGYQAPDIGLYIDHADGKIDFNALEVRCVKDGYVTAHVKVPDNKQGRVPLEIVMMADR